MPGRSGHRGLPVRGGGGPRRVGVPGPPWPGLPAGASAGLVASFTANLGLLAQAAPCGGAFNAEVDADGVLRRVDLLSAWRQGVSRPCRWRWSGWARGTTLCPGRPAKATRLRPCAWLFPGVRGGRQAAQVTTRRLTCRKEPRGCDRTVRSVCLGGHDRVRPPRFAGHACASRFSLAWRCTPWPSVSCWRAHALGDSRAWRWGLIVLLAALNLADASPQSLASMACVLGGAGSLVLLEWLAWRGALLAWPVGGVLGAWLLGAGTPSGSGAIGGRAGGTAALKALVRRLCLA